MNLRLPLAAGLLALVTGGVALAYDDAMIGTFDLSGRTSRGERVDAQLRIDEDGYGRWRITRTGREGWREPLATWVATDVTRLGRNRLRVTFQARCDDSGLRHLGRRIGGGVDVLVADYQFSYSGQRVSETVRNLTPNRGRPWTSLETSGRRVGRPWAGATTRVVRRTTSAWGTTTTVRSYPGASTRTVIRRTRTTYPGAHGHLSRGLPHGTYPRTRHGRFGADRHRRHRSGAGVTFTTRSGGASFSISFGR